MIKFLLDVLFPKKCAGCGRIGSYFCIECRGKIAQKELVCPRCEHSAMGGETHPICRRRYGLEGLWSLGVYHSPLREVIHTFKYRGIKELSDILTDIILEYWVIYQPYVLDKIKKDGGEGWAVVSVPLFWYRENARGFNQSSLIAKSLAQKLGLEYADVLKRVRYTKSQTKLKGKQRQENIKEAFDIIPSPKLQKINSILLIDDVWTTGSTMRECCYILKRAGIKKVWAITLAR